MGMVYIIYINKDRLRPGGVLVNGNLSSVLLVFSMGFWGYLIEVIFN